MAKETEARSNPAKISPPIIGEIYLRKRLFRLLDRMGRQAVVWMEGPAGSGKTTLVASYLKARNLPCLWFQTDQGDTDPATFFYYLGLAAKRAAPRKRKPLPLFTPEYLPGMATFAVRYFEALSARLPSDCVLVFDNYQEVGAGAMVHDVIRNGLQVLPPGMKVILVSRESPPPALIRLCTTSHMGRLCWEDLRLSPGETKGIARTKLGKLSSETAACLQDATDGWAAGLILMLEHARTTNIEEEWLGKLTPEEVSDYFAGEIFYKSDPETRDFLVKSSLLSQMNTQSAAQLTGLPHAARILSRLNRNNLFTEKRFQNGLLYQYHPLFREFLQARAKETLPEDHLRTLRREAARILEAAGEIREAVLLLHDAGDWPGLSRLTMTHAPEMLAQGRNRMLASWLNLLPPHVREDNPWLYFWLGASELPFDPTSSRPNFERALALFKLKGEAVGCFRSWSGIVDSVMFSMEGYDRFTTLLEEADELIARYQGFPSGEIEAQVACGMAIIIGIKELSRVEELDAWVGRVFAAENAPGVTHSKIQILSYAAMAQVNFGRTKRMAFLLSAFKEFIMSEKVSPFVAINGKVAETIVYQYSGQHDECIKAMSSGLELSEVTGVHTLDNSLLAQGIISCQNRNDPEGAERYIDRMALSFDGFNPWEMAGFHHLKCRQALIRKDPPKAAFHGARAMEFSGKVGTVLCEGPTHLLYAQAMYAFGDRDLAEKLLADTLRSAKEENHRLLESLALSTKAYFFLDQGQEQYGLEWLGRALAFAKEYGFLLNWYDQPVVTAGLCVKALEAGIEVEYAREIIRRRRLVPDEPPLHLEGWPWPVKVFALGRFELHIHEEPLTFSRKVPKKQLALLKALIAFGGRKVAIERITDLLWPQADGDMAEESFKVTLRRLRKLIAIPEAVRVQGGSVTLEQRHFWSDVLAFDKLMDRATALWGQDQDTAQEAAEFTRRALAIYRGPFLSGENTYPFTLTSRNRLRARFLKGVQKLGRFHEANGELEKAAACYSRALEVEEINEGICRCLMGCHLQLGQRDKALAVYEQCRQALQQSHGKDPSPKTEALRKMLY